MIVNTIGRSPSSASSTMWALLLAAVISVSACGGSGSSSELPSINSANDLVPEASAAVVDDQEAKATVPTGNRVVIETSLGDIVVQLNAERAPGTVANFLDYVDAGHYSQTIFHRVIPGFMIQGGGFSVDYQRNETSSPIRNEADNGLANDRYTIAMARTSYTHSATDQFFINVVDNPFLNYRGPVDGAWGYAVFGRVTAGFDVIEEIVSVTTGAAGPFTADVPVEPVVILSIDRF